MGLENSANPQAGKPALRQIWKRPNDWEFGDGAGAMQPLQTITRIIYCAVNASSSAERNRRNTKASIHFEND